MADQTAPDRPIPWARVVVVGVIAGFMSGLFGIGGGTVIVPALAMVAAFPHKLATGTSLTAIAPISIAGGLGYATAGEVDWAAAALVSVGALGGTFGGTYLLRRVPVATLQILFAGLLVVTAARLLMEEGAGAGRAELVPVAAVGLVLLGVASGALAGLLGVGGGVIIVPALTILVGLPVAVAKGTSLLVIVPTAILGTLRNRRSKLTALRPALVVGGAGIVTAVAASRLSIGLDPELSTALFAGLLVVVAARTGLAGLAERLGS